jgi:hypothetical protein
MDVNTPLDINNSNNLINYVPEQDVSVLHYNDMENGVLNENSNETSNDSQQTCIICLEPDNLLHSVIFTDNCRCEYQVHYGCLNEWISRKSICIICKKKLQIRLNGVLHNIELKDGDILCNYVSDNESTNSQRRYEGAKVIGKIMFIMVIVILMIYLLGKILD